VAVLRPLSANDRAIPEFGPRRDARGQRRASIRSDGTRVIGWQDAPKTGADVVAFPLTSPSKMEPLVQTPFAESFPELSPDGRYFAYQSNELEKYAIHVRRSRRWTAVIGKSRRAAGRAPRGRATGAN